MRCGNLGVKNELRGVFGKKKLVNANTQKRINAHKYLFKNMAKCTFSTQFFSGVLELACMHEVLVGWLKHTLISLVSLLLHADCTDILWVQ